MDWGIIGVMAGLAMLFIVVARFGPEDDVWEEWPDLQIEDVVEEELQKKDAA